MFSDYTRNFWSSIGTDNVFILFACIILTGTILSLGSFNFLKLAKFKISGVIFFLGPTLNVNSNTVFGGLLVLAAACSYAVNTIFATRLPSYDPLVSSSCGLILASVISFLIWPDIFYFHFVDLSLISGLSILLLGIFPTAIALVIYFNIVNSAGATFLSNINYLIPVVAFFLCYARLNLYACNHGTIARLNLYAGGTIFYITVRQPDGSSCCCRILKAIQTFSVYLTISNKRCIS